MSGQALVRLLGHVFHVNVSLGEQDSSSGKATNPPVTSPPRQGIPGMPSADRPPSNSTATRSKPSLVGSRNNLAEASNTHATLTLEQLFQRSLADSQQALDFSLSKGAEVRAQARQKALSRLISEGNKPDMLLTFKPLKKKISSSQAEELGFEEGVTECPILQCALSSSDPSHPVVGIPSPEGKGPVRFYDKEALETWVRMTPGGAMDPMNRSRKLTSDNWNDLGVYEIS